MLVGMILQAGGVVVYWKPKKPTGAKRCVLAAGPGRIFMEAQCAVGPSWLGVPPGDQKPKRELTE